MTTPAGTPGAWPPWQRVLFRFFCVYFLLQTAPWGWFGRIPGVGAVNGLWFGAVDWAVRAANARVFHVREVLILPAGSGDTSWAWAQLWLYLAVSALACVVWSVLDRKRLAYPRLGYVLRTIVRYYIALFALSYGIIKIFALQMPFPTLSLLSTPLGDLLPMRFSWQFIGYSTPYQVFSGVMETVAGLLLLYRRTVTLGLFAATGAFLNVVMINLSYDVPVKLFASHLLLACLFLLAQDARRLLTFLVLDRGTGGCTLYAPPFTSSWSQYARWATKALVVFLILVLPFRDSFRRAQALATEPPGVPFGTAIYEVRHFVLGGDTLPPVLGDTVRWRDVIFDGRSGGSVGTTDTLFWQRYRRGYFRYRPDTVARTLAVWKSSPAFDSTFLFTAHYEKPDSTTVRLRTAIHGESLFVELVKSRRHFQLAERQFHWLSEYNR